MAKKKVRRTKRKVVKRRKINSHEKGHLFEDVAEKYFQLLGYSVERNVKVRGFSGATHEIDVLISKGGLKGVVEAKNYSKPIPKEWVMKAHSVAKDIGAQEVYVVSASGFTEDAVKVAEVLGVKLLSLEDMVREVRRVSDFESLSVYHVRPVVRPKTVKECAEKHVVKKFFKPIEEVDNVELVYHPFYVLDAEYTYTEETGILITREVEKKTKLTIFIDAIRGSLLVLEEDYAELTSLPLVTKDEAELLSVLSESDEPMSVGDVEDELGWSRQKISKMLSKLVENGLVDYEEEEDIDTGRSIKLYYSTVPSVNELKETGDTLSRPLVDGKPGDTPVIEPKIPLSNIAPAITSIYDVKIVGKKLVYLPIYKVKFVSTEDDSYRYMYFLACTEPPLPLEGIEEGGFEA